MTERPASPPALRASPGPAVLVVRALGVLAVLGLVVLGAVGVVTELFQQERTDTRSYPGTISTLAVSTDVGSIRVQAGPAGSAVRVAQFTQWSFREPAATGRLDGDVLRLEGFCRSPLGRCSVDFDVTVPADTILLLTSSTGSVRVDGATTDVTASTSTGDLDLRNLAAARLTATTSTGNVTAEFTKAPTSVRARTSTGDLTVVVPDDDTLYDVDATTSIGDVFVDRALVAERTPAPRIEARSSTGSVRVGLPGRG